MESTFLCFSSGEMIAPQLSLFICAKKTTHVEVMTDFTISACRPFSEEQNQGWHIFINNCQLRNCLSLENIALTCVFAEAAC